MEKFIRNITVVEDKARNIRINHGLTQKEFGEMLGISKSYVSDIENGYTGLSVEHINKICNNYYMEARAERAKSVSFLKFCAQNLLPCS